jgi:integrase
VFRHAIKTARGSQDPTIPLAGATPAPKVSHHAALLEPREIGGLVRAINGYQGNQATRAALRLMMLTFVRTSELRFAVFDEFDLEGAMWTIPGERMKMGLPHFVPLSPQAVAIVQALKETSTGSKFLFPSVLGHSRPISENTINTALRRMGYEKADMTGHGFRRMASTSLNELGWNSDAIERQLAHKDPNQTRRAYNAAEYLPDRTRMMSEWARWLEDRELLG